MIELKNPTQAADLREATGRVEIRWAMEPRSESRLHPGFATENLEIRAVAADWPVRSETLGRDLHLGCGIVQVERGGLAPDGWYDATQYYVSAPMSDEDAIAIAHLAMRDRVPVVLNRSVG